MTKPHDKRAEAVRALCAAPQPGDGVNPKEDRKARRGEGSWKKDLQLCKQVARAIGPVIDVLREAAAWSVELLAVEPESGGQGLRVVVAFDASAAAAGDVLRVLGSVRGRLRAAMGEVITRKRVPELSFAAVPREAVRDE